MSIAYQCVELTAPTTEGLQQCIQWQAVPDYGGYKLTNAEMSEFILSIAALFAVVAAIKIIRRAFF